VVVLGFIGRRVGLEIEVDLGFVRIVPLVGRFVVRLEIEVDAEFVILRLASVIVCGFRNLFFLEAEIDIRCLVVLVVRFDVYRLRIGINISKIEIECRRLVLECRRLVCRCIRGRVSLGVRIRCRIGSSLVGHSHIVLALLVLEPRNGVRVAGDHVLDGLIAILGHDVADDLIIHLVGGRAVVVIVGIVGIEFDDQRLREELSGPALVVELDTVDRHELVAGLERAGEFDVIVLIGRPVVAVIVGVESDFVHRERFGNVLGKLKRDRVITVRFDLEPDRGNRKLVRCKRLPDGDPVCADLDCVVRVGGTVHMRPTLPYHYYKTCGQSGCRFAMGTTARLGPRSRRPRVAGDGRSSRRGGVAPSDRR